MTSTGFALRVVRLGPVLILVAICLAVALIEPLFLTGRNIANVGVQASLVATIAMGQLVVVLTRGIDLSIGSCMALSTVVGALAFRDWNMGGFATLLAIVGSGAAIGFVNGLAFVKGRVPHPFIVTLAMLSVARGLALMLSDGVPISGMPPLVRWAGSGWLGPLPAPVLITTLLAVALWVATTRLVWGRWVYCYGGNPDAARDLGVPTDRVLVSVYVVSGLCAGIAGLITAGRTNSGFGTAGQLAELDAVAAVIIGGASFFGGRGSVVNALSGALIITVVRNGMNLVGVSTYWQLIVIGLVVVGAVRMDVLRMGLEARFRGQEALHGRTL